jgi:photosystem II stability/assembly factor-like uncharacterized protein
MKKRLCFLLLILFATQIGFAQWQQTSCPTSSYINCFTNSGTDIFVGTAGHGIYLTSDSGNTWTAKNSGLGNLTVTSMALSGTTIFAGTYGGVYKSINHGSTWTSASPSITVTCLAISDTNIFAGTDAGIYLSVNNGATWTAVNTGLTNLHVRSIAISGNNIFAGTWNSGGVFLSTNNGGNWTAKNSGITNLNIYSVAFYGTEILAGTGGGGIFLSLNNGTSWSAKNTGLVNLFVQAFAIRDTNIFAGTFGGGVYRSKNNAANWVPINYGLTNSFIFSLNINGKKIYAGTNTAGVWRCGLTEYIGIDELGSVNHLLVFPNPASEILNYTIDNSSFLNDIYISVYDLQGKLIFSRTSNLSKSEIDINNLPKGIYLLKIIYNQHEIVKKFVKE